MYSNREIDLLNRTRSAVLLQIDPGSSHLSLKLMGRVFETKLRIDHSHADGADAGFPERQELFLPPHPLCPDPQSVIDRIALVDPAVPVLVIGFQLSKAVAGLRAKEFRSVIDRLIPIDIQRQKAAAGPA